MFTKSHFSQSTIPGAASLRRIVVSLLALALLFSTSLPSFAWNGLGHESVAYIAYQKLTPEVKARANALLKLNPYYDKWLNSVPPDASQDDRDMMIFMQAATWPDQIKGDRSYTPDVFEANDDRDLANLLRAHKADKRLTPEVKAQATALLKQSRNYKLWQASLPANVAESDKDAMILTTLAFETIGYGDKHRHGEYHFYDDAFTYDNSPLPQVPTPNAQTQIAEFRQVLQGNDSDDAKSYALVWVMHLVGDVHQPLHCSTRVSADDPQGDRGGNLVDVSGRSNANLASGTQQPPKKLTFPEAKKKSPRHNLHSFWDAAAGKNASLATVIDYASSLPPANFEQASDLNENDWIEESFELSKDKVYSGPIGKGDGPFTIDQPYKDMAKSIADQRMELGGARLANVLNNELK